MVTSTVLPVVSVAVTVIVLPPAALPPTARAVPPLGSTSMTTELILTVCLAIGLTTPFWSVAVTWMVKLEVAV